MAELEQGQGRDGNTESSENGCGGGMHHIRDSVCLVALMPCLLYKTGDGGFLLDLAKTETPESFLSTYLWKTGDGCLLISLSSRRRREETPCLL